MGSLPADHGDLKLQTKPIIHISTADLRSHNKATDAWISIQGKVYDVTSWLPNHPGGDLPLLSLAGEDATDAFVAYHPGSAWAHLDKFYVGKLTDYKVSDVSKDFRRMNNEFIKLGLFEKKGHGVALSFTLMSMLLVGAIYASLWKNEWYWHLAGASMLGFLWNQSGFVGHDSGHYNVMSNSKWNRIAQIVTGNCMTGISIGWWKRNHTAHHIACNSLDFDPDLQHLPMFCISNQFFRSLRSYYYDRKMSFDMVSRFLVSYQHYTFYPVMCVARVNLFAQSVLLLASNTTVPDRWQEILGVIVFWIWYPYVVSCMPNWGERFMFVMASFCITAIQHVQFTLNHFSGDVYVGQPKGNDWFEKQTAGTVDISCSTWMDWFHGGLQFQVEHHLFPRLPRCHLRMVSPMVRELCKKHGLKYMSASFIEANRRTIGVLRNAAMQARDLSKTPKNLVWEAVHTHG